MGGSSGGGTTTVQKADPWSGAQPYLTDVMKNAQQVYQNSANNQYYPGSTVVPFSPASNEALNMIQNRATQGSPLISSAQNELNKTISGGYLDPTNDPAYQTMMNDVTNQVNSQFGAAGRTGSGMNQQALARGLAQGGSALYDQERQRQMQGMLFAPQMANQDYYDAGMLGQVGAAQEQQAQNQLNDQVARYNYNQNLPLQNLQNYSSIINGYGGLGGTSTSTGSATSASNPILGGLGGGLAGFMAGNMIMPGIGGLIGGGLGLLGGAFG